MIGTRALTFNAFKIGKNLNVLSGVSTSPASAVASIIVNVPPFRSISFYSRDALFRLAPFEQYSVPKDNLTPYERTQLSLFEAQLTKLSDINKCSNSELSIKLKSFLRFLMFREIPFIPHIRPSQPISDPATASKHKPELNRLIELLQIKKASSSSKNEELAKLLNQVILNLKKFLKSKDSFSRETSKKNFQVKSNKNNKTLDQKRFFSSSTYQSDLIRDTLAKYFKKNPEYVIHQALYGTKSKLPLVCVEDGNELKVIQQQDILMFLAEKRCLNHDIKQIIKDEVMPRQLTEIKEKHFSSDSNEKTRVFRNIVKLLKNIEKPIWDSVYSREFPLEFNLRLLKLIFPIIEQIKDKMFLDFMMSMNQGSKSDDLFEMLDTLDGIVFKHREFFDQ